MRERRRARGLTARIQGRRAEAVAALMLMLKGYRIIGFRVPTPSGEVDIVAARGSTLAIMEVKRRASLAEALEAVSAPQRRYLRQAGRQIAASRTGLRDFSIRLDLIGIAPGRLPRHIADAWPEDFWRALGTRTKTLAMTREEAERVLRVAGAGGDADFPLFEAAVACAIHDAPERDTSAATQLMQEAVERLTERLQGESAEEALAEVLSGRPAFHPAT